MCECEFVCVSVCVYKTTRCSPAKPDSLSLSLRQLLKPAGLYCREIACSKQHLVQQNKAERQGDKKEKWHSLTCDMKKEKKKKKKKRKNIRQNDSESNK